MVKQGLQVALDHLPDVIVSDLAMPTMTGYELARAVRESHPICHLPMIALSGYGDEKDKQASQAAGFDVHLVKPVDAVELVATIEKLRLGEAPIDR